MRKTYREKKIAREAKWSLFFLTPSLKSEKQKDDEGK